MSIKNDRFIGSCARWLMIACSLLMQLCLFGCGAQTPPPPRGPDAPVLEGREAIAPGERIDVETDSGEHFEATVLSVSDNGFKVTDKKESTEAAQGHYDGKKLSYEFGELTSVSTVPKQSSTGFTPETVLIGVVFLGAVVILVGMGLMASGLSDSGY